MTRPCSLPGLGTALQCFEPRFGRGRRPSTSRGGSKRSLRDGTRGDAHLGVICCHVSWVKDLQDDADRIAQGVSATKTLSPTNNSGTSPKSATPGRSSSTPIPRCASTTRSISSPVTTRRASRSNGPGPRTPSSVYRVSHFALLHSTAGLMDRPMPRCRQGLAAILPEALQF